MDAATQPRASSLSSADYDYVVVETAAGALLLATDLVGPALDAMKLEAGSDTRPVEGKRSQAELKIQTSIS